MADILEIEDGVLKECTDKDVESVVIPDDVTVIGESAFEDCRSLASVEIPSSVTEIGSRAFAYCKSLSSVVIPSSVTAIGGDAFRSCESLASVEIPEGVSKIGEDAFYGCESLSSVEIPSSVTEIGTRAFYECTSLSSMEFCGTVEQLEAVKGKEKLCAYLNAKSVKCSDGEWQKPVLLVENGVAVQCLDKIATSVTIPEGVTEIGSRAFAYCESLSSVGIPSSVTAIGDSAFEYCKSLSSVEIPEGVSKIGEDAFHGCESLSSVEIPSSVTEIGEGAFKYCESLSSVEIPSSVKKIGTSAFNGCKSLSSVEIPSSVTEIGNWAFEGCKSLSSMEIPSSVTAIGKDAFEGCKSLSSVAFGGTVAQWEAVEGKQYLWLYLKAKSVKCADGEWQKPVVHVENGVAVQCLVKNATSVTIPSSVTEIGTQAFEYCKSLSSVEFGGTVAQWGAVKGKKNLIAYIPASSVKCSDGEWQKPVVLVENGVAVRCLDRNATSVTIPEGVTEIGKGVFSGCSSLASVVIPSSVTEIDENAFLGCTSLSSMEFGGTVAQLEAVNGKENLCKYLNAKSVKCADGEWQKLVVHVENGVALKCLDRNATSVTIPEGVTEIGEEAFNSCKSLSSVVIPSSVTKIGEQAFSFCESLSSVVIPEGVTEIGKWAFLFCKSLSSVVIPSSVTEIGDRAFDGCESLSSVEFGGTAEEWEDVEGKRELLAYIPASSVKFSDDEEFDEGCLHVKNGVLEECTDKDVKSVVIPESVTGIGEEAFKDCTSLSSVEIPSSVTAIGEKAFYGCKSLSSVEIPLSVRKIGKYAFMNCNINKLSHPALVRENGCIRNGCAVKMREKILYCASQSTSVTIPEGVTEIGEFAFYGCESLASVVIPSSVKKIGNSAFDGCKSLSSVEIPSSVSEIGKFAFNRCNINELSHPLLTIKNGVAIRDNEFSYLRLDYLLDVSELPAVSRISEISDNNVFYCASQSTSVTIPEGVTKIGREAFKDCTSLLSVEIPSSVTKIGSYAFKDCSSLESVEIPSSVTEISVCAFDGCKSLSSVEFSGTVAQWEALEKSVGWNKGVLAKSVKCADGEAAL